MSMPIHVALTIRCLHSTLFFLHNLSSSWTRSSEKGVWSHRSIASFPLAFFLCSFPLMASPSVPFEG